MQRVYFGFFGIWDEPEEVYSFYDNNNYVCDANLIEGELKYDERKRRVDRVLPFVNKNTKLLDIGCGNGNFLKDIKEMVDRAEGMEVTKHHIDSCRSAGLTIHDTLLDSFDPQEKYDVVVMHATLEHVANLPQFVKDLKRITHANSHIFIEVPSMRDPLANTYDIEKYRKFFYRQYHMYYFSEISLSKLFTDLGFKAEVWSEMMVSLTNHMHWMSCSSGQKNTNTMVNVNLPVELLNSKAPNGTSVYEIWNEVDDLYRERMENAGLGDMLVGRFSLRNL